MRSRPRGLRAYGIILGGQFFSMLGSHMTAFALALWAWDVTGKVTALALATSLYMVPARLIAPLMGTLIDRWDRRKVLIVSDVISAGATLAILVLYLSGALQVWHLLLRAVIAGLAGDFQDRAFNATVPLLAPKKHFTRVAGLVRITRSGSGLLSPVLAATLYALIGLGGVVLIDLLTFAIAVATIAMVTIPQPPRATAAIRSRLGAFVGETLEGFRYIVSNRPFLGACVAFGWSNVFKVGMMWPLLQPLILARTGGNGLVLAQVNASISMGVLLGSLMLVAWGGFRRRLRGWFFFCLSSAGALLFLPLGKSPVVWIAGIAIYGLLHASDGGHALSFTAAKVPPGMMGRVQGCRDLISRLPGALFQLAVGPLADLVFEPAMSSDTWLSRTFGSLVGQGPGAGMAMMVLLGATMTILGVSFAFSLPKLRNADRILPDRV